MKLIAFISVFFIFSFSYQNHVSGNGSVISLAEVPWGKSEVFNDKKFGLIFILNGKCASCEGGSNSDYFQFTETNPHYTIQESILGKKVTILGNRGGNCDVLIKQNGELETTDACKNEMKKLFSKINDLFIYPHLKGISNSSLSKTPKASHVKSIKTYIRKKLSSNSDNEIILDGTKIEEIGSNNSVNQYFVTTRIKDGPFVAFVLKLKSETISELRRDYAYYGNQIRLNLVSDINGDGLGDIFEFQSDCCSYYLLYDTEKWIKVAEGGPA